jgi:hypothetical protein
MVSFSYSSSVVSSSLIFSMTNYRLVFINKSEEKNMWSIFSSQ